MNDHTKATGHVHGAHEGQAEHAAKGLLFYGLHPDKTWTGPHASRAAANPDSDPAIAVVRFNPHQTAQEAAAEDAASAAGQVTAGA